MKKKIIALGLASAMVLGLAACGSSSTSTASTSEAAAVSSSSAEETAAASSSSETAAVSSSSEAAAASSSSEASETTGLEDAEIQVFIAASLSAVMEEVAAEFNAEYPNITITYNADSSGTLMTQIQEGAACDIFFSAAQKQMNTLEEDGLLVEGTRSNVVNNQVCVIKAAGTETAVTGLENIGEASSIALADGSVPVGKYTRTALMNLGILPESDDPSAYTTQEVSDALGGVTINECSNVSKVREAVINENEVGTVYYSDTYNHESEVEIIEMVSYDLTGNVIYPISMVVNPEATEAETAAAEAFLTFVTSDTCKAIFDKYLFDTENLG